MLASPPGPPIFAERSGRCLPAWFPGVCISAKDGPWHLPRSEENGQISARYISLFENHDIRRPPHGLNPGHHRKDADHDS